MKHSLTVLVAFLLLTTSAVYAQPVPSAPYTGTPAVGPSSGQLLWSQLDEPSGEAFTDQAFEAGYVGYDCWGADDFVVDAQIWEVSIAYTPGTMLYFGINPLFVNTVFYADAGGIPGNVICEIPANSNFFSFGNGDITTWLDCALPQDTVWFSQQVRLDFIPMGQHYWASQASARNHPALWKNPGGNFLTQCFDWQPANAVCGMTGEDFSFQIWGWPDNPSGGGGVPAMGPFGAVLLVLALGGGSAYVLRRRR